MGTEHRRPPGRSPEALFDCTIREHGSSAIPIMVNQAFSPKFLLLPAFQWRTDLASQSIIAGYCRLR
jgi:hypothetical protein